ncbi:MAG: beta-propeller fold lactonase family protein, partial [Pseudomonadales bacterium]|nr:beta-propeller fold lactonase family protein [Pseudomonadales bacterium]
FDASNAPALISLSLVGNQLESVTLNKNQQLNYLNLSNNHLTTIDISQSPQLKTLYLNENQLTMTTIASDIQNIQNTDVKIGLSGNDFSSDTLKALGGLSQLSTPYTGVSYDQNKVLPALLVTENINRAEFTAVPSGVQLSLSASEGEYPVYVAASEEDSFSISNVEQALYFNIQIDDINSEHSFYIVFSDTGEIWNSNNNLIGMLLDTDSEFSNAATLSLGDLSAHDVNETVKVNIYNKTLALSIVKPDTQNDIVVIKLYDAEDPAAEAIYSHSFDASISGANLQAINRVVIYAADALTAPPSKIIQYAQPPIQYNHAPPVPQLRLIAKPGSDQQVVAGDMVTLDASNSVDLDGEIFSYVWSENGTVLSTDKVFNSADFSAGEHIITLTVTNDKGQTSSNILVINALAANNNSPSAPYMLVSGWGGENIEKISTETDTIIETIPVTGCGNLREIDIMPDNKTAYGVCPGLGLYYLNLDSSTVTGSVMVPNNPITAVITSDQSKAYVSQNSYDAAISVIDLASEKITDTISGAQSFGGSFSHLSPDGSKAYLSTNDGANILVIDTTTNALLSPVTTPGVSGMATSPDGATIYAAYFTENAIGIISTDTDSETMRITGVFKPRGLAVSPDGKTLVASSLDSNNISVINLVTQTVTTIDVGTRTICAAFDPKGIKVYICDIDGNAVLPVDIKTKTIGTRIVINDFQPQIISPYN